MTERTELSKFVGLCLSEAESSVGLGEQSLTANDGNVSEMSSWRSCLSKPFSDRSLSIKRRMNSIVRSRCMLAESVESEHTVGVRRSIGGDEKWP